LAANTIVTVEEIELTIISHNVKYLPTFHKFNEFWKSKSQFWKILVGYSSSNDNVEEFFWIFIGHYMRYRTHGFTSYLDAFHAIRETWFKERILVSDRISTFQKVLEVLAINPKTTIGKLVEGVGESELNVKEVLSLYSYRPRSLQDTGITNKDYIEENSDFITENIIIIDQ